MPEDVDRQSHRNPAPPGKREVPHSKGHCAMSGASPLGATVQPGGVNFSLFSRSATGVELLLFDRDDDAAGSRD